MSNDDFVFDQVSDIALNVIELFSSGFARAGGEFCGRDVIATVDLRELRCAGVMPVVDVR